MGGEKNWSLASLKRHEWSVGVQDKGSTSGWVAGLGTRRYQGGAAKQLGVFLGSDRLSGLAGWRVCLPSSDRKKQGAFRHSCQKRQLFRRVGSKRSAPIRSFAAVLPGVRGRDGARYVRSACPFPSWVTQSSASHYHHRRPQPWHQAPAPKSVDARVPFKAEKTLERTGNEKKGDQDPGPLRMLPTPPSPTRAPRTPAE